MKCLKSLSIILIIQLLSTTAFADKKSDDENAKWVADSQKENRETLKKVDKQWAYGCVVATALYADKYRKINDGLSASYTAESICALISDEEQVKAHLKEKKDLKYLGCIDGIAMGMQMFDKKASNQRRREVIAQYCM